MKRIDIAIRERFALLDFHAVPYRNQLKADEPMIAYQVVLIDRQMGWAQINAIRLFRKSADPKAAWSLLTTWAEQVANGRYHPGEVARIEELLGHEQGSAKDCLACERFFVWVVCEGGFGPMPEPPVIGKRSERHEEAPPLNDRPPRP